MLTRAWIKAERMFHKARKSDTGPPYCAVFSTACPLATIPADFDGGKYPGLLFLHFSRSEGSSPVVAYWTSEASFRASHASLARELSLRLHNGGLVSDLQHGQRSLYQRFRRLSLREVVVGASTIVGALLLIINFAGDTFSYLFAAPRIDVLGPDRALDVLEDTPLSISVKLRSRLASRNIEVEADPANPLRLEAASLGSQQLPPTHQMRLEIEGGRPPLLAAGQTTELNLRFAASSSSNAQSSTLPKADTSDPRPDQLRLSGGLLANRDGWLWPRLRYEVPHVVVRLWSKLQCAHGLTLSSQLHGRAAAKVAFLGRIYAGEQRDAVGVYVEALNTKDLEMSATDGDRLISQQQSFDGSVKVLEWTRGVRAFSESTFVVVLETREAHAEDDWQKIGNDIKIACR